MGTESGKAGWELRAGWEGASGGWGKAVGTGLRTGHKQALEKLLPHSSLLCLLCSLSCGSFSSIEDATGTRVRAFPKGLS